MSNEVDEAYAAEHEESERKRLLGRQQDLLDLQQILSTMNGQRFFRRFFKDAHLFHTTFSSDPNVSAFNEGARNLGLKYLADVTEIAPNTIPLLVMAEIPASSGDINK